MSSFARDLFVFLGVDPTSANGRAPTSSMIHSDPLHGSERASLQMEEQTRRLNGVRSVAFPPIDGADNQLWLQIREISETFQTKAEEVWAEDFRPDLMPMLFVRWDGTRASHGFAFNIADTDSLLEDEGDAVLPASEFAPDSLAAKKGGVWFNHRVAARHAPVDDEVRYAVEVGIQDCLVFDYNGPRHHTDTWEFARFVVHEAFHQYQLFESRWKVPPGYDPATPYPMHEENIATAVRETRLLDLAVLSVSPITTLDLLRRFMAVRAGRHRRWPELASLERGHEQTEGTARYVENAYSRVNGRAGRLQIPTEALTLDADWLEVGRFYRTGARILELLDWFGVEWAKKIADGADPFGLLAEHMQQPGGPDLPRRRILP